MQRIHFITGTLSACLGVIAGAFGAHSLKSILDDDAMKIFHTAVEYQFYHSLGLLFCGWIAEKYSSKLTSWAGNLFIAGIILFSGSLYFLSASGSLGWLGAVTPIGGLCFIAGWIALLITVAKNQKISSRDA